MESHELPKALQNENLMLKNLVDELRRKVQEMEQKLAQQTLTARQAQIEEQQRIEAEEEFITNNLLKKLEKVQGEKHELLWQLEREEEYLTNTLQKKFSKLQKEKIDLENRLEQEEEYIVHKLQLQLTKMLEEKHELERQIEENGPVELQIDFANVRLSKMADTEKKMKQQLKDLQHKNFILEQKLNEYQTDLEVVTTIQIELEREVEITQEKKFNTGELTCGGECSPIVRSRNSSLSHSSPPGVRVIKQQWLAVTICHRKDQSNAFSEKLFFVLTDDGFLRGFENEHKPTPKLEINMDLASNIEWEGDVVSLDDKDHFKFTYPDHKIARDWFSLLKEFLITATNSNSPEKI